MADFQHQRKFESFWGASINSDGYSLSISNPSTILHVCNATLDRTLVAGPVHLWLQLSKRHPPFIICTLDPNNCVQEKLNLKLSHGAKPKFYTTGQPVTVHLNGVFNLNHVEYDSLMHVLANNSAAGAARNPKPSSEFTEATTDEDEDDEFVPPDNDASTDECHPDDEEVEEEESDFSPTHLRTSEDEEMGSGEEEAEEKEEATPLDSETDEQAEEAEVTPRISADELQDLLEDAAQFSAEQADASSLPERRKKPKEEKGSEKSKKRKLQPSDDLKGDGIAAKRIKDDHDGASFLTHEGKTRVKKRKREVTCEDYVPQQVGVAAPPTVGSGIKKKKKKVKLQQEPAAEAIEDLDDSDPVISDSEARVLLAQKDLKSPGSTPKAPRRAVFEPRQGSTSRR